VRIEIFTAIKIRDVEYLTTSLHGVATQNTTIWKV